MTDGRSKPRSMAFKVFAWHIAPGLLVAGCVTCGLHNDSPFDFSTITAIVWVTFLVWCLFQFCYLLFGVVARRYPLFSCVSRVGVNGSTILADPRKHAVVESDAPSRQPRPAGRKVHLFNESFFRTLRKSAGIDDDFLDWGWSFDDFRASTGKGGTPMAFVDHKYIVKELSTGDHANLLKIAASYFQHIKTGESLLCGILMHFEDVATKVRYFVMKNAMGSGRFDRIYDLKGCDDDKTLVVEGKSVRPVHKRFYKLHLWGGTCCWNEDRFLYYRGKVHARKLKIHVSTDQRQKVLQALERDTKWLAGQGLMDYSLLVGVKGHSSRPSSLSPSSLSTSHALVKSPSKVPEDIFDSHIAMTEDTEVRFAIIDFLQSWEVAKEVAACFKFLEPNRATVRPVPYAIRFLRHFDKALFVPQPRTSIS
eukprot:TRINITY_DN5649_c0_g2_i1.p1 TRINITY_DN5649_c0_g2~~TRINITY_DN5649_c0_g2_i1.p1  ORF type:complete len:443 (-),score=48.27 TRINITY_DN5649_c0_g2_i1:107-1372(-)